MVHDRVALSCDSAYAIIIKERQSRSIRDALLKFTTFIPTSRNDGSAVTPSELTQLVDALWQPFGGVTNEGIVQGAWIDPTDGQRYDDELLKVSVVFPTLPDLQHAVGIVESIGRQLDQKAMYLELSGADGPYIIAIT